MVKKLIKNRKGETNLRSIVMVLIFVGMAITSFLIFISEGSLYYNVQIDPIMESKWDEINQTTNNINDLSKDISQNVEQIKDVPLTGVVLIPATLVDALLLPIKSFSYMSLVLTDLNAQIGMPVYALACLEAAFLILIAYLIMEAYLRHKGV